MVQPYNYTIQAPSAFEQLVSGLKLGASVQEMEAAAQQRRMQMEQARAQQEQQARQRQLMDDVLGGRANRGTWLEIGMMGASEAQRKGAWDQVANMDQQAVRSQIGFGSQLAFALKKNPTVAKQMLADAIRANPNDDFLKRINQLAETDPEFAAETALLALPGLGKDGLDTYKETVSRLFPEAVGEEKAPEDIRILDALGLARTPENFAKIKQAGQRPEAMTALQKAQAARQTLIAQGKRDSQEFRENEQYIKNQLVDPNALTAAQIESNRLAQARLDQMERMNSPGYQAALAEAKARGTATGQSVASKEAAQRAAVAALKSIGYDTETGEDDISKAIASSTSGGAQADIAALMRYFGGTTKGMQAIGKLQSIASRLTLEILDGNLGAGISNPDREFILQGLGDIGNPRLTASERLAAWTSAKNRMVQVGILPVGGQTQTPRPVAPQGSAKPVTEMSNDEILRRLRGQ